MRDGEMARMGDGKWFGDSCGERRRRGDSREQIGQADRRGGNVGGDPKWEMGWEVRGAKGRAERGNEGK